MDQQTGRDAPSFFQLQWHVTQRCNLRCTHCYQESYANNDLPLETLLGFHEQYKAALTHLSRKAGRRVKGHITLTGGELFMREDIFGLLDTFKRNKDWYDFSVLTNGTMITDELAQRLAAYSPSYVQVSIEGTKETHDKIRGNGSYDRAMRGLESLAKHGVQTVVSFTAHRQNLYEFPGVVRACKEIGVTRVWSDRLIPCGNGEGMRELAMTKEDTKSLFHIMREERDKLKEESSRTHVAMHRALQFLGGGAHYSCQAGNALVALDANGDLYPCRRMPIKVGNLREQSLLELYCEHPTMQALRTTPSACSFCTHYTHCKGGLRCLSYATSGDPFAKDPGCWVDENRPMHA